MRTRALDTQDMAKYGRSMIDTTPGNPVFDTILDAAVLARFNYLNEGTRLIGMGELSDEYIAATRKSITPVVVATIRAVEAS